mmetsp:Transcript_30187/g.26651  ORF Transcript_30187/g.26651 Transcript_30187/m.26651 type:complete len:133 (+) Transcript_30187:1-399(+)
MLFRRITFLKFLLSQLLKERTQSCYFHIITSTFIYLYKLMDLCPNNEYKQERSKMTSFLKKWLPKEWDFINEQFKDCPPMKRSTARSIKAFDSSMDKELNDNQEDNDFKLEVGRTLKKCIVDYNDHLYVAKH